jgi:hypothetical protein
MASEISFKCEGCGQVFTLGRDALVVTTSMLLGDFQGVTVFSASTSNRDRPDLVASLERSWDSVEPETKSRQGIAMKEITSYGQPRWWRCRKCNTVQTYNVLK